jgi:hypothetical protein
MSRLKRPRKLSAFDEFIHELRRERNVDIGHRKSTSTGDDQKQLEGLGVSLVAGNIDGR